MRKITDLALKYIEIRFVLKRLIGPTPIRKGPIDRGLSVCLSVGPSMCTTGVFWKLAYYFFLIFCMKLGDHKGSKMTQPDFSEKFAFWLFCFFLVKNGPTTAFLEFSGKLSHLFWLEMVSNERTRGPLSFCENRKPLKPFSLKFYICSLIVL